MQSRGYTHAEIMNPAVQLKSDDEIFDYFKFLEVSRRPHPAGSVPVDD